jgi:FixJ family two-component response regulator
VILSAHVDQAVERLARERGAADVLSKPIELSALAMAVTRARAMRQS